MCDGGRGERVPLFVSLCQSFYFNPLIYLFCFQAYHININQLDNLVKGLLQKHSSNTTSDTNSTLVPSSSPNNITIDVVEPPSTTTITTLEQPTTNSAGQPTPTPDDPASSLNQASKANPEEEHQDDADGSEQSGNQRRNSSAHTSGKKKGWEVMRKFLNTMDVTRFSTSGNVSCSVCFPLWFERQH